MPVRTSLPRPRCPRLHLAARVGRRRCQAWAQPAPAAASAAGSQSHGETLAHTCETPMLSVLRTPRAASDAIIARVNFGRGCCTTDLGIRDPGRGPALITKKSGKAAPTEPHDGGRTQTHRDHCMIRFRVLEARDPCRAGAQYCNGRPVFKTRSTKTPESKAGVRVGFVSQREAEAVTERCGGASSRTSRRTVAAEARPAHRPRGLMSAQVGTDSRCPAKYR